MLTFLQAYKKIWAPLKQTRAFFCRDKKLDFFSNINQSMYYVPRVKVQNFLENQGIDFKESLKSLRVKQCRFCTKPHYNDITNMYCLNIDKETGIYHCFRCQHSGSWMDFKRRYLGINSSDISSMGNQQAGERQHHAAEQSISEVEYEIYHYQLDKPEFQDVKEYLKMRGFNQQTIKKYKIGAGVSTFKNEQGLPEQIKVIYFPMYKLQRTPPKKSKQSQPENEELINTLIAKCKLKGASKQTKKYIRQYPSGYISGFFGLNTIKKSDKTVVITQGQFDAMSVNQATGYPAISLPLGANVIPQSIIANLNQFEKVILWMDNDEAGKIGCEKIAHQLGIQRTHIVKNDQAELKDANDFLLKKPTDMINLIDKSKTKADENIMKFADLREEVKKRIFKAEEFRGIKIGWLPFFNKKVKGVRMEELTIFSGPTGSGKTTFLSQLSLDLCKKNIPVLWGSFQIRNPVLLTNMLYQFSEVDMTKNRNKFDYFSEEFEKLPLYYLSFHGSTKYNKALDIIEYAIEKHNISVVIIDTLQFFLSGQAEGFNKFDLQERVLAYLRQLATNYKVHIIVVIHPRKVQETEDIHLNSIYGSGKATQQADNVWIIQNRENFRIFDVKKNRFDGQVGKAALGFDKSCKSFIQLNQKQLTELFNKSSTMQEIMSKRKNPYEDPEDSNFTLQNQNDEELDENQMMKKQRVPRKKNPLY